MIACGAENPGIGVRAGIHPAKIVEVHLSLEIPMNRETQRRIENSFKVREKMQMTDQPKKTTTSLAAYFEVFTKSIKKPPKPQEPISLLSYLRMFWLPAIMISALILSLVSIYIGALRWGGIW